jgi:hypothetical protein
MTRYRGTTAPAPHSIVVDFGEVLNVGSVLYGARADSTAGRVKEYEIYLSADGKEWAQPVARGTLPVEPLHQSIPLPTPAKGRYLRFVVVSEHTDAKMAAIAELDIVIAK